VAGCFNELDTERENEFLGQLEQGVHEAHQRVSGEFGNKRQQGPATTLTMVMLVWPRAYIVHAGDSRAYYLRKGRLLQLTQDQTMGEFMVGAGAWTETQAQRAPASGSLISAVGGPEMTPAVGLVDLQPGDILLLCTDGLSKHVPSAKMAELLAAAPDAATACRTLVDAALADGGSDNVTVVVARMEAA
jgi:protein phosphatase